MEEFQDRPEAAEAYHAKNRRNDSIGSEQCSHTEAESGKGEHPPATLAKVVFSLDYEGMEKSDYDESGRSQNDSGKVHNVLKFLKMHLANIQHLLQ